MDFFKNLFKRKDYSSSPGLEFSPLPTPKKKNKGAKLGKYNVLEKIGEIYQAMPSRKAQIWQVIDNKGEAGFIASIVSGEDNQKWVTSRLTSEEVKLYEWQTIKTQGVFRKFGSQLSVIEFDTILQGRYLIKQKLVTDGVQATYKAKDTQKDTWVYCTLAIPHKSVKITEEFEKRVFESKTSLIKKIHPRILNVLDENIVKSSGIFLPYRFKSPKLYYCISEYCSEINFMQLLRQWRGRLEWEQVANIFFNLCEILSWLQQKQWLHGNIRPHHLWLSSGKIYLNGFSLRKNNDVNSTAFELLRNFSDYGYPVYMSPEQIDYKNVSHFADQFLLGILMTEVIWGKLPFKGKDKREILQKLAKKNPSLRTSENTPKWLVDLILRLLSKNPQKRFVDPQEISKEIVEKYKEMELEEGEEIVSTPPVSVGPDIEEEIDEDIFEDFIDSEEKVEEKVEEKAEEKLEVPPPSQKDIITEEVASARKKSYSPEAGIATEEIKRPLQSQKILEIEKTQRKVISKKEILGIDDTKRKSKQEVSAIDKTQRKVSKEILKKETKESSEYDSGEEIWEEL